ESAIDVFQRKLVGDHGIDLDLSLHVPVDDFWHIRSTSCSPKRRSAPNASGHQLEGARADFLPGAGHADDDAFAPSLVAALEGLTHDLDTADAFKGVVRSSAGEIDDVGDQVAFDFSRIDKVSHAESLRNFPAARIDVHSNDHVGAGKSGSLDHVESDTAQAKDHDVCTRLHFGRVDDGSDPG